MAKNKTVRSRPKKSFSLRNLLSTLLIITTLLLLFYPIVVNWWIGQQNVKSIQTYQSRVSDVGNAKVKKLLADAEEYNAKLYNDYIYAASQHIPWNQPIPDYNKELAVDNTGIMGYITIPQIQVKDVPIYHGDSEKVLASGIGHIEQTSLPIGGVNSHAVLPAHSGRVNNTLFTNLDKLKNGDVFYLHVLNKELKYRVISQKVVEPKDTSDLNIVKGKDLVTLITCYPTGINNKRLLVTGERTALTKVLPQEKVNRNFFGYNFWVMAASSLLALIALLYLLALLLGPKLYQAGLAVLKKPKLSDLSGYGKTASFGTGFYLTNDKKLAERWLNQLIQENEKLLQSDESFAPVINVYRLCRLKDLSRWIFKGKTENWQKYIEARQVSPTDDKHELVIGPVADETYRWGKRTLQYRLNSDEALQHLKYLKSIKKDSKNKK